MNVHFFFMNIHLFSWTLLCWFILFPYQAINRLSKGSLTTDVKSLRTEKFDRYKKNEMEEDIRKEQKKMKLQQQVDDHTQKIHNINTRIIPLNIQSKLIVVFSV